jgi:putative flippase GtrA
VGLISNISLYIFYLVLTEFIFGPKASMTIAFALGVLQTFVFNKRWTFSHRGFLRQTFVKYLVTYGIAYLLNLLGLVFFVDRLGYPHQLVQAIAVITLAVMLFITLRVWVFCNTSDMAVGKDLLAPRLKP